MKFLALASVLVLLTPLTSFASTACSPSGVTVIYVNGILTTYPEAKKDLRELQTQYIEKTADYSTNFITGYNESHIGGGGDIAQSAAQIVGKSFLEFDKNTILMQIQPQVTTQKILLLGHSQGTFYTNAIYKYLTDNGVPAESITVYNLATPADRVEGGGAYLTSSNDRFINAIRRIMIMSQEPPLPANINIPIPASESNDAFGGHHFQSDYLGGASGRIVSDMESALRGLKAGPPFTGDGCFPPPPKTLGYKAQTIAFAVADPTAQAIKTADVAFVNTVGNAASASGRALGTGIIITGKAIVFTVNVATSAVITAAQKASAAAAYAAAQLRNVFASASSASGSVNAASQLAGATLVLTTQPKTTASPVSAPPSAPAKTASIPPTEIIAKAPEPPPTATPPVQPQTPPQSFGPALVSVVPGFGGGGGAPTPMVASSVVEVSPPAPVIVPLFVQTPLEGALFATTSVTFSGTTTPSYSVVVSYESATFATVADADGSWSITAALPEGTTAIGIVATDSDGNTSDAITRTVTVDATAPSSPALSVAECASSLSTSFCLIPTTSASLSWPTVSGASYYAYAVNGAIVATTTGTGATLSLTPNTTSTISVAAYDSAGNAATSTPIDVYVLTQPIIINEIAWAGTLADASDEWIELKNNSSYALNNLSNVAVVSADGSRYIQLSGAIAEGGYYLIERRAEATSATGDLVFAFDELSQDGEELKLQWGSGSATTTIDATPAVSTCGGWCSGIAGTFWGPIFTPYPMTMERKTGTDGSVAASWQNGTSTASSMNTDASGNTVSGTPRAQNSDGGELPPPPGPIFGEN